MNNKDEALTYEELTALCRKQEEYIKELENKIYGTLSDKECSMPLPPTYKELEKINKTMDEHIAKLKKDKTDSIVYVLIEDRQKQSCPHCGSKNIKYLYRKSIGKAHILATHFICQDCMIESVIW